MIIITGATGQLGSLVTEKLLDRVAASDIGVSVRDAARATALSERGVRVREGEFSEPGGLDYAFEDAEQVLIVSPLIIGRASAASKAAIDAATRAGASRVLYTSHQASSPNSLFGAQPEHAAVEEYLASQKVPFTALRHGYYTKTLRPYVEEALRSGEMKVPEDGPFSWTAHDDLAEVDAIALAAPGTLDGVTSPLVAPEQLGFSDIARILSDLTGRTITHTVMDDDEWVTAQTDKGVPASVAEFTLGMFRAARSGEFAVTDPALEALLGRPAIRARTVLEGYVTALQT